MQMSSMNNSHRFRVEVHHKIRDEWTIHLNTHTHYSTFEKALKRANSTATSDCFDEIRVLFRLKGKDYVVHEIHDLEIRRRCKEYLEEMDKRNQELEEELREIEESQ